MFKQQQNFCIYSNYVANPISIFTLIMWILQSELLAKISTINIIGKQYKQFFFLMENEMLHKYSSIPHCSVLI